MTVEVRSDATALGMSAEMKRRRCPATDSRSPQLSSIPAAMLCKMVHYCTCTNLCIHISSLSLLMTTTHFEGLGVSLSIMILSSLSLAVRALL